MNQSELEALTFLDFRGMLPKNAFKNPSASKPSSPSGLVETVESGTSPPSELVETAERLEGVWGVVGEMNCRNYN